MARLPAAVVIETGRAPVGDFSELAFWCAQFCAEVDVSFPANTENNNEERL